IGYELALAQLALGGVDDYRETCFKLLAHFGDLKVENEAHWLAWGCCLAPDAVSDFAVPIAAAEVALRFNPESVDHLTTLGAIQYRADQYDQALATLLQASELASAASTISPAYCWYFLAMTHQQLGRPADANEWLKKANEKTREELGTEDQPRQAGWNRRLTLQLLREEAEQLVLIESDFREASPAIRP
ncbi:MAG: tetratricopeptide repeat protein, partial [Planctomycetales bacterium]|nr:tetratricopeptide repeat protein [Planctomycetales bacterium]